VGTLGVNPIYTLAALPDGRLLTASEETVIRVWDAHTIAADAGAGAPVAATAAAAGGGDAAAATPALLLEGHTSSTHALELLPGGRLASASWDGTVRLWRLPAP